MTGTEVTRARVEKGQEPIHDLSITAKQCAIIDFVGQLCKEYEIPHNRGFNIRYMEIPESRLQASVEVLSTLAPTTIEFVVEKSQAGYGWKVYTPANFPGRIKIESCWRKFTIYYCLEDGKYHFTPSGRNLRLGWEKW